VSVENFNFHNSPTAKKPRNVSGDGSSDVADKIFSYIWTLMKYEKYQLESDKKLLVFEYESLGPKGRIKKIVQYTETNLKNFYNLGLGGKDEKTGEINDQTITNNGYSMQVLATVASTVYAFTSKHPDAWVYTTGSNNARTRLYRMGITNNLLEIKKDFEVYGLKDDK
jgi:hypothetical protein